MYPKISAILFAAILQGDKYHVELQNIKTKKEAFNVKYLLEIATESNICKHIHVMFQQCILERERERKNRKIPHGLLFIQTDTKLPTLLITITSKRSTQIKFCLGQDHLMQTISFMQSHTHGYIDKMFMHACIMKVTNMLLHATIISYLVKTNYTCGSKIRHLHKHHDLHTENSSENMPPDR